LQRRHRDALPETAHPAYAALGDGDSLVGINPKLFAVDFVARQLASPNSLACGEAPEPEFPAQFLEVELLHLASARQQCWYRRPGQPPCHRQLDGGAGFAPARGQLSATMARMRLLDGSITTAVPFGSQRVDCRLAMIGSFRLGKVAP
jgi:hypothetical protein